MLPPATQARQEFLSKAMAHGKSDEEIIKSKYNISRFCVQQLQVTWVMLIAVCIWGVYSYRSMPQRKDPDTPVKSAVAITGRAGGKAEKIEQLVTRKVEEKIAQNARVDKIRSISRTNFSVVYVDLDENMPGSQVGKELDDIALKLGTVSGLPDGAGPVNFIKDFGDTAALMLTVASPKISETGIDLRTKSVSDAITRHRAQYATSGSGTRFTIVIGLAQAVSPRIVQEPLNLFADYLKDKQAATDLHVIVEPNFVGVDGVSEANDEVLLGYTRQFIKDRLQASDFHPDSWQPVVIRDPKETRSKLASVAGGQKNQQVVDEVNDVFFENIKKTTQPI